MVEEQLWQLVVSREAVLVELAFQEVVLVGLESQVGVLVELESQEVV